MESTMPMPVNPQKERLSVVEAPQGPSQGMMPGQARTQSDNMTMLCDLLAKKALDNGKYAREHGEYIHGLSVDCAKQFIELGRKYSADVLAAEGRRTTQLKQALGNVDRGPTSQG